MIAKQQSLTEKQLKSFDRFLVDGTRKALNALEVMFGLNIDSSDSTIEIAPAVNSETLKHLGNGTLYVVSSSLVGDLQGSMLLLMRSDDFKYLGEMMRPILSLLFLSAPDADLSELDSRKPDWMQDNDTGSSGDTAFDEQMMDTLAEMGNVLFGLYTKAMCNICALNSHHSVPEASRDPEQRAIQKLLSSSEGKRQLRMIIENEFVMTGRPIKIWCLISPEQKSFQEILGRIENRNNHQDQRLFRPVQKFVSM